MNHCTMCGCEHNCTICPHCGGIGTPWSAPPPLENHDLRRQLSAAQAENAVLLMLLREVHNEPVCLPGTRPGDFILAQLAAAQADLALNATMLAKQTDLAREAETRLANASTIIKKLHRRCQEAEGGRGEPNMTHEEAEALGKSMAGMCADVVRIVTADPQRQLAAAQALLRDLWAAHNQACGSGDAIDKLMPRVQAAVGDG